MSRARERLLHRISAVCAVARPPPHRPARPHRRRRGGRTPAAAARLGRTRAAEPVGVANFELPPAPPSRSRSAPALAHDERAADARPPSSPIRGRAFSRRVTGTRATRRLAGGRAYHARSVRGRPGRHSRARGAAHRRARRRRAARARRRRRAATALRTPRRAPANAAARRPVRPRPLADGLAAARSDYATRPSARRPRSPTRRRDRCKATVPPRCA